jgi:hypothetical protein
VAYLESGLIPPSFTPLSRGNSPEVDHIVPKVKLRRLYESEGRPPDDGTINNAGNYRLVERDENRSKSDIYPDKYYDEEAQGRFRRLHLIPAEVRLDESLTVAAYEDFVRRRRDVLFDRIRSALGCPDPEARR